MESRKSILICVAVIALAGAVFGAPGLLAQTPAEPQGGASETFTVRAKPVRDLKAVFATVESLDVALGRARIGGVVTTLAVDEGDHVEQGQLLAVIGDEKIGLQESGLSAQVRALEAARASAVIELERARRLFETGFVAKARLDSAQTAFDVADNQLKAIRAQRSVVDAQGREGNVLAPSSGVVLHVPVVEGAVVTPGEMIARIATENYVLRIALPERHARFMKVGDRVRLDSENLGDDIAGEGRILRVYPQITEGRVFADAHVEGLGGFFVGERMRVLVGTKERQAMLVPSRFIATRFGIDFVQIRSDDGGGHAVVVQRGRASITPGGEENVEILSGITDGDVLIAP